MILFVTYSYLLTGYFDHKEGVIITEIGLRLAYFDV